MLPENDALAAASCGRGRESLSHNRTLRILLAGLLLALLAAPGALAQSRGPTRSPPAQVPSGHQNEAVDLNEGKSAAELFQSGCSVCHQSAAGLAKGRREGELTGFLRQHYTSGVQHAAALAGFLAAAGARGGPATATRGQPVDRPPASIGSRRPPADDDAQDQERRRKPQEASRSPEREPASKRRAADRHSRTAPAAAPAPAAAASTEVATDNPEPDTSAVLPPPEEKPQPPEIPL